MTTYGPESSYWGGAAMTRMLASVTGPDEAEVALQGGADIVDVVAIPGGVVDVGRLRETVARIAGRATVSAASASDDVARIAACGVDIVRVAWTPSETVALPAAPARYLAVFGADGPPDATVPRDVARRGFAGAMLDTSEKDGVRLVDQLGLARLRDFVANCHAAGLSAGLAGSLEPPDIPRLLVLGPDLLGFRAALCGAGGRGSPIELSLVQAVRRLIPAEDVAADTGDVDYRLLAARGQAGSGTAAEWAVDHILVEDLVLPVFIGAYAREQGAPQAVRFAVDASVTRHPRATEDMRDVFSYDLITDGIRLLTETGHVPFVETLAERIAAMVLAHDRVVKVMVRVQKLETGSGTVGVEIERARAASRGAFRPVVPLSSRP
jgi:dihydroneopterin aldolase